MKEFVVICTGVTPLDQKLAKKVLEKIAEAKENGSVEIFSSSNNKAIEFANIVEKELGIKSKTEEILCLADTSPVDIYAGEQIIKIPAMQRFVSQHRDEADSIFLITYYQHYQHSLFWLENEYLTNNNFYFPVDGYWKCKLIK